MILPKSRQNSWRLLFPEEIIPDEIREKYANVLRSKHSFFYRPIDLINGTIQKIQVLGFSSATISQFQTRRGSPLKSNGRITENEFLHSHADVPYRSPAGPSSLVDRTINVDFKHVSGFLNYFLIFESFFYQYSRDTREIKLPDMLPIEIFNENGECYARIILFHPVIDGMDMLDLDFTQPIAQSQTFRVIIRYSDLDFEFIETDVITDQDVENPMTNSDILPVDSNTAVKSASDNNVSSHSPSLRSSAGNPDDSPLPKRAPVYTSDGTADISKLSRNSMIGKTISPRQAGIFLRDDGKAGSYRRR